MVQLFLPALLLLSGEDAFSARVAPFVAEHCAHCHGGAHPKGDLVLERFHDEAGALADRGVWLAVREKLSAGEMPPEERPRPAQADVEAVLAWIDGAFGRAEPAPKSGLVGLRRLTRSEYENTVRDLLGVEYRATEEFPADDVGHGFDRIADVLSTSDIQVEKALRAAERIAAQAIVIEDPAHPEVRRKAAANLVGTPWSRMRDGALLMFSNSDGEAVFSLPRDGDYVLRVRAFGEPAGPDPPRMAFKVEEREVARFDVLATALSPQVCEARVRIRAGERRIAASFINDYYKPDDPDPSNRDRNLGLEWLEVAGPVDPPVLSAFQRRELDPKLHKSPREIVERLAARAWRRPPSGEDVGRLLALSPEGAIVEVRVRAALMALLVSPRFLFLVDFDPEKGTSAEGRIDDWGLASRLSYFLWSSLPDQRLLDLAGSGRLREKETLLREVQRMIDDARATAFAEGFAGQWLQLSRLDRSAPDPARFPDFDEPLRAAMRAETEMLFESVLREGRPAVELLTADYALVNERLARHYGIAGVRGEKMRRVHLDDGPRGGLLAQASILTVTSNPTRTSPAKRGRWILENLLGDPPPPPPPGVGVLDDSREAVLAASLRERLARHRVDPACGGCHARIDALGFALENFDAVGGWRETDSGFPIDAAGTLPDGRSFSGAVELKRELAKGGAFVRCLSEKLATYALSRGLSPADEKDLDKLLSSFGDRPPALRDLVAGIVAMDAFRRHAGGGS